MSKIWKPDLDYGFAEVLEYGCSDRGVSYDSKGVLFFDDPSGESSDQPVPLDFPDLTMTVSFDPLNCRPDYFSCNAIFMVSESLKSMLDKHGVKAQYTQFSVSSEDGALIGKPYYHCNCPIVDCFDFANGKYTFFQNDGFRNRVDSIKKLAIDESKASAYPLFRIANGGEHLICVSDDLAAHILNAGMVGITFVQQNEWNKF